MMDNIKATFILAAEGEQSSYFNIKEFVSVFGVLCGSDDKRKGVQELWTPVPLNQPDVQMIYAELTDSVDYYKEKWNALFYMTQSLMESFTKERGVVWKLVATTADPLHLQMNQAVRVSHTESPNAWDLSNHIDKFFKPTIELTKTFED